MASRPAELPQLPQDVEDDLVGRAVLLLGGRWGLTDQLAALALTDMANDLSVEVDALARFVLDSIGPTAAPRTA